MAPGDRLKEAIAAASEVVIAAPYLKAESLSDLLKQTRPGVDLSCITRWLPGDISVGASDVVCRQLVFALSGRFLLHPSLHAKYYRFDEVVFVGSANLTAAALGWAQRPNVEILCHPGEDFDQAAFEEAVFENSREVSDQEFAYWQNLVGAVGADVVAGGAHNPLMANWQPATRDPRNLLRACRGEAEAIASLDERMAATRDMQALGLVGGESEQDIRTWAAASLLSTSFAGDVLQVQRLPRGKAVQRISEIYECRAADARRSLETTENWLAYLAPDLLSSDATTERSVTSP